MAAPVVSGLVARMRSANPHLAPAEVRAIISKTSTPIAAIAIQTNKEYDTGQKKPFDAPFAISAAISSFRDVGKVGQMLVDSAITTNEELLTTNVAGVASALVTLAASIALCRAAKSISDASTPH